MAGAEKLRKGRKLHTAGYILVYSPEHPDCDRDSYVFEHRLVAEKKIGRYLYKHEIVHHKNGKVDDNRPENIEVMTQKEHAKLHYSLGKYRWKKGEHSSPGTEFKKGLVPWNKKDNN